MIIPLEEFPKFRESKLQGKRIVCTSGYFDPIHPGHVSCVMESKKFGDILVIIVDGDNRASKKKGKAFIPATDRADIVDSIKGVDYVVIYDNANVGNCKEALEIIKPDVFTKGGDRNDKDRNDPSSGLYEEANFIESYGGRIEYGVGRDKVWSSSNYLQEWVDFIDSKKD